MKKDCFFCGKEVKADSLICEDPKCIQFDKELRQEIRCEERRDIRMALVSAISQRAKNSHLGSEQRIVRWLYTAKAVVCILLGLYCKTDFYYETQWDYGLGYWDYSGPHGEYSSYDWKELYVGSGWFSNWWYLIEFDSSA
jgi:hypothetical protein